MALQLPEIPPDRGMPHIIEMTGNPGVEDDDEATRPKSNTFKAAMVDMISAQEHQRVGQVGCGSGGKWQRSGPDFIIDKNRSNALIVLFMVFAIFIFFVFFVTDATPWIHRISACTGVKRPILVYVMGMVAVPIASPVLFLNDPMRSKRFASFLALPTLVGCNLLSLTLIATLTIDNGKCELPGANRTLDMRPILDNYVCPYYSEGGLPVLNKSLTQKARLRAHCDSKGGELLDVGETEDLFLGIVPAIVPLIFTWVLMALVDVVFVRLLLTPQNMKTKRVNSNLSHTTRLLEGMKVDVGSGALCGGSERAEDDGAVMRKRGGAYGRSVRAVSARPRALQRLSARRLTRGELMLDVMGRLRPLFEGLQDGAASSAADGGGDKRSGSLPSRSQSLRSLPGVAALSYDDDFLRRVSSSVVQQMQEEAQKQARIVAKVANMARGEVEAQVVGRASRLLSALRPKVLSKAHGRQSSSSAGGVSALLEEGQQASDDAVAAEAEGSDAGEFLSSERREPSPPEGRGDDVVQDPRENRMPSIAPARPGAAAAAAAAGGRMGSRRQGANRSSMSVLNDALAASASSLAETVRKGGKRKKAKNIDDLSYLPSVVQIAVLVGLITVLFVFCGAINTAKGIQENEENLGHQLRNASTALKNLTNLVLPQVVAMCGTLANITASGANTTGAGASGAAASALMQLQSGNSLLALALQAPTPPGAAQLQANLTQAASSFDGSEKQMNQAITILRAADPEAAAEALQQATRICASLFVLVEQNKTLVAATDDADWVADVLEQSSGSTLAAFVVANLVALFTACSLGTRTLFRYRDVQQLLRRGRSCSMGADRPFHKLKYTVSLANKFVGLHLGSVLFGYIIITLSLLIVLSFLFNPLFYEWAWGWQQGSVPVGLIVAFFQIFVLDRYVGDRWLSDGYWIDKPVRWTWYSSVVVMASVITGLVASVKRFVFLTAFSLASVMVLDTTRFPTDFANFDQGYTSFMAVAMLNHRHKSPVLAMARDLRFGKCNVSAEQDEGGGGGGGDDGDEARRDEEAAALAAGESGGGGDPEDQLTVATTCAYHRPPARPNRRLSSAAPPLCSCPPKQKHQRAKTRWHLAFTMLNNPQLVMDRGHTLEAHVLASGHHETEENMAEDAMSAGMLGAFE